MAKLPFVVEPRREPILELIGSEESGQIQVERRGYLTTGEKAFVQQVQQYDDASTDVVSLTRRVARKYSLGMDRAYTLVLRIVTGAVGLEEEGESAKDGGQDYAELAEKIEEEYATDLTNVIKALSAGQIREELVYATCMLRYRIDSTFDIEDVTRMHPDLISGLATLYREEERRSVEAFLVRDGNQEQEAVEPKQTLEEAEKKPVTSSRSRSKTTTGA